MPSPLPVSDAALRSVYTSNLLTLFAQWYISLVVSTYQAGKVIVVRTNHGVLNTHFRAFGKPMGIAAAPHQLIIGSSHTVWDYHNVPAVAQKLESVGQHDACYLSRRLSVTGDNDLHELAYAGGHTLWVVNTRFGCLCTLEAEHSFVRRWRLPFVRALAPEDRCHLNGLGMMVSQCACFGSPAQVPGRQRSPRGGSGDDTHGRALVMQARCVVTARPRPGSGAAYRWPSTAGRRYPRGARQPGFLLLPSAAGRGSENPT